MTDNFPIMISPDTIANALSNAFDIVQSAGMEEEQEKMLGRILRTAANNVRMLFEFRADDNGKFRPINVGQVWFLVDMLMRAKLAPSSYDNDPAKVFIGLMKANELDTDPITGLANIMIVNNRATVWGDLAQALIQRSGLLKKQVNAEIGEKPEPGTPLLDWPDSYGWRVETWRKDQEEPHIGEYTVADAKRANLWMNTSKKPWITDPSEMIFNRARARSQRKGFSDSLLGFAVAEEQRDFEDRRQPAKALPAPADEDDEPVTAIEHHPTVPVDDFGSKDEIPISADAGEAPTRQGDMLPIDEKKE
jgi:hypothetical protein